MTVAPPQQDPEQARYMADLEARKAKYKDKSDAQSRILGGVLILIGLGLGYYEVIRPILEALRGAPSISYSYEGICGSGLGILLGIFLLIFGASRLQSLQGKQPKKWVMAVLLVLIVILTLASIFGMNWIMKSLGYY